MNATTLISAPRGQRLQTATIDAEIRELRDASSMTDEALEPRLRALVAWLNRHGRVADSLDLLEVIGEERLARDGAPSPIATTLLRLRGITRRLGGDLLGAADDLMKAKVYAELAGDVRSLVRALTSLGNVYGCLSHWSIAERCYEEAMDTARALDPGDLVRTARQNLIVARVRQGRVREALPLLRDDSSPTGDAETDAHMGVSRAIARAIVVRLLGFRAQAGALAVWALETAVANGYLHAEAMARGVLAELALDRGDHRSALSGYRDKLRIAQTIAPGGDLAAEAYRGIAEAYLHRGQFDRAERALAEAWRICGELHDDFERVALLRIRASLALERGDAETADRTFRDAIRLCTRHGYRLEEAITLERQGFGHMARGRESVADRHLGDAEQLYGGMRLGRHARRLRVPRRALSREWPPRRRHRSVEASGWRRHGILTRDPGFMRILEQAEQMAPTPLPVLVIGESGVGKELVARAVHTMSGRGGALVDINCPAIPEPTLENELFGCTRGAFTGAEDRPGLIAGADRGTLFLDEIGDIPRGLQAKLLRFLETGTYRRLGSHAVDRVDSRVVSATNARLDEDVDAGRFRRDLYHRIAGVVLPIPPLRERRGDIELLARHFAALIAREQGREAPALDGALVDALTAYDWPGNVRELKHVIECLVWTHPGTRMLSVDGLSERLGAGRGDTPDAEDIRRAMAASSGRVAGAARELGVSRQRLYRRAAELSVDLTELRRI